MLILAYLWIMYVRVMQKSPIKYVYKAISLVFGDEF